MFIRNIFTLVIMTDVGFVSAPENPLFFWEVLSWVAKVHRHLPWILLMHCQ